MIKKYLEFINEELEILLESNIAYSDSFKKVLSKIDSPLSKSLLDLENKDFNTASNYFDMLLTKNDTITFIPDRKAQEILGDTKEIVRYIGNGGGFLRHVESNAKLFAKLGYEPKEKEPYRANAADIGEVIAKVTSDQSGKTYAWVKFKRDGEEKGEAVYNVDKLAAVDNRQKEVWVKNRQEMKVGRAIRALLRSAGAEFNEKEIETFVNSYKMTIDKLNDRFSYFEEVKGDDIAHWYFYEHYYERKGTIGNSCMSNVPSEWFDIYTSNPNQVNLVILKSQTDDTKITGRALLWTLPDGKKFMDRIYTINDSDVNLFRDYAKENGWYYKFHNSSTDLALAVGPDDKKVDLGTISIILDKKYYDNFPYLDTLKYFTSGSGLLSNKGDSNSYILEDTEGGYTNNCQRCGGSGRIECEECYGSGEIDCHECNGSGEVKCTTCNGTGNIIDDEGNKVECEECDGAGKVDCEECNGYGKIECEECGGCGEYDCPECNY